MKILYLIPWPKPFEDTNIDLSEIVNTQFGYYTLYGIRTIEHHLYLRYVSF